MKFSSDFDSSSLVSGFRQVSDASAQATQQMREQFRAATADIDSGIRQQLANEIRARQQHGAEIQKITSTTVRDQTQQWNGVFTAMNRGFASTVTSMTSSSRSLQQGIARMLERMVATWVAQHTFMQVFGIGSQKAATAANIGSSAAEGAAAAYASAAAIPVVGWSIAPAVAAE